MITATSEATLGSSKNELGNENNSFGGESSISHPQPTEDHHVDEDIEMRDTASVTQMLCTEQNIMWRTSSSSSLERRLADRTLWGYIDPRTEWPEWQEVLCNEDIDAVLAARRARNRQLGKWLDQCFSKRRKLRSTAALRFPIGGSRWK